MFYAPLSSRGRAARRWGRRGPSWLEKTTTSATSLRPASKSAWSASSSASRSSPASALADAAEGEMGVEAAAFARVAEPVQLLVHPLRPRRPAARRPWPLPSQSVRGRRTLGKAPAPRTSSANGGDVGHGLLDRPADLVDLARRRLRRGISAVRCMFSDVDPFHVRPRGGQLPDQLRGHLRGLRRRFPPPRRCGSSVSWEGSQS